MSTPLTWTVGEPSLAQGNSTTVYYIYNLGQAGFLATVTVYQGSMQANTNLGQDFATKADAEAACQADWGTRGA